jgi:glycosyltransferase involved in cell wall biosynthesis
MRMGIDAYVSGSARFGGFTHYISRLVEYLAKGEDELLVYVPTGQVADVTINPGPTCTVRRLPFDLSEYSDRSVRDVRWHQEVLNSALYRDAPDVILGTSFFLPLDWPGAKVVTVHDLVFEHHPEFFTEVNLGLYKEWGRRAAEHADAVICVSRATAADVADIWGITGKPVAVTLLGSSLRETPKDIEVSRSIVRGRLGVTGDYILNVGATHPRKNLRGVLDVYTALPTAVRESTRLVLMNADHPAVWSLLREHGVHEDVVVTDWLPNDVVPHVYHAAALLLHPAYREGFGLPVLDAMVCGTPVVGSDRPAVPEIAEDAALLHDPDDAHAMAKSVARLLGDDRLRAELGAAGRRRSSRFGWEGLAASTRAVLAAAVADRAAS